MTPELISVRQTPACCEEAIAYIKRKWANRDTEPVYTDCIRHALTAAGALPQWYLLVRDGRIIGCAGLITNDFISRMDLYPWLCALYIEPDERGNGYGAVFIEQAKKDSRAAGFKNLYLCTDHIGYYEHYGFHCIGEGYHPWGESSRIYEADLS